MTGKEVLKELRGRFGDRIVEIVEPSVRRAYVEIKSEALPAVASYIFKDLGARFNIASGVDGRDELSENWEMDKTWHPAMTAEIRAAGCRNWRKAVERTLNWLD